MIDCWLIWKKYFLKVALIFISTKKNLLFIIRFTFKSLTWIPIKYLQISLCCFPVYTFVGDFVPHFHTSAEVSFNTGVTQKRSISRFSQAVLCETLSAQKGSWGTLAVCLNSFAVTAAPIVGIIWPWFHDKSFLKKPLLVM